LEGGRADGRGIAETVRKETFSLKEKKSRCGYKEGTEKGKKVGLRSQSNFDFPSLLDDFHFSLSSFPISRLICVSCPCLPLSSPGIRKGELLGLVIADGRRMGQGPQSFSTMCH